MLLTIVAACTSSLFQTPAVGGQKTVDVKPVRLDRLALPIYGTEHLLQLKRVGMDSDDKVLPVLLRFREGEQLQQLGEGGLQRTPAMELSLECAARAKLFKAASKQAIGPFAFLNLADGCNRFSEVVLRHLAQNAWEPRYVELDSASAGKARYREEVTNRDMGAFTEAAPSSVRVGETVTLLCCEAPGGEQLTVELDGPGEGIMLSWECGFDLPLRVPTPIWEERAVVSERLPLFIDDSGTDLDLGLRS